MPEYIQFTKEDLAKEKLRRQKEKSDRFQEQFSPYKKDGLWEFCKYYAPEFYFEEKFLLKKLCNIFQRVTLGELKKVLISFFPRGGKSRTTDLWIAWHFGYYPDASFMRNCYSAPLANELSQRIMDIIDSDKYRAVFPNIKLDPQMRSKDVWRIDGQQELSYFGSGIQGTITGRGCKTAAILDDPIKNPEEALSETFLNKVELAIAGSHNTRMDLKAKCAQIIISTRWSKHDPIGNRWDEDGWEKYTFSALGEDGKSICEAMFSTEDILDIKESLERKGMGWLFQALYQGIPVDNFVSKFNADELKYFSKQDLSVEGLQEVVAFCDYANKGTDYLSMPIAFVYGQDKYIVDVLFSDQDSETLKPQIIEMLYKYKPQRLVIESNQGGQEFYDGFIDKYENILNSLGIEVMPKYTTTNKEIRILVRSGEIKNTCYFLQQNERSEMYQMFFEQLIAYGKLKSGHDDAPDSLSGLLGMLSESGEVDVQYFGIDKKVLDNKYHNGNVVTEYEDNKNNYSSDDDVIFF